MKKFIKAFVFSVWMLSIGSVQAQDIHSNGDQSAVVNAIDSPIPAGTAQIGSLLPTVPFALGANTCTTACTNVAVIPAQSTQGYKSIQLQVTSAGTGVTAYLQGSNDPVCSSATNWTPSNLPMYSNFVYTNGTAISATNLSFLGAVVAPITTNCIRVMMTAYSSGTYTIQGELSAIPAPATFILGPVATFATPGNGTQVGAGATGTTGAIAPSEAAASGKTNFVCHVDVTSSGTTVAALFAVTLTGLSVGTLTFEYYAPTAGQGTVSRDFSPCLQASATNTAITFNVPALGTGTSAVAANISGFQY